MNELTEPAGCGDTQGTSAPHIDANGRARIVAAFFVIKSNCIAQTRAVKRSEEQAPVFLRS